MCLAPPLQELKIIRIGLDVAVAVGHGERDRVDMSRGE